MQSKLTRRSIVRAGGVAVVGALAGCASPGGDDEGGDGEGEGEGEGGGGEDGGEDDDGGGGAY